MVRSHDASSVLIERLQKCAASFLPSTGYALLVSLAPISSTYGYAAVLDAAGASGTNETAEMAEPSALADGAAEGNDSTGTGGAGSSEAEEQGQAPSKPPIDSLLDEIERQRQSARDAKAPAASPSQATTSRTSPDGGRVPNSISGGESGNGAPPSGDAQNRILSPNGLPSLPQSNGTFNRAPAPNAPQPNGPAYRAPTPSLPPPPPSPPTYKASIYGAPPIRDITNTPPSSPPSTTAPQPAKRSSNSTNGVGGTNYYNPEFRQQFDNHIGGQRTDVSAQKIFRSLGPNSDFKPFLDAAARRTGLSVATLAAVVDTEAAKHPGGRWNADSRNPRSSAVGLGQFLRGSWIDIAKLRGSWLRNLAALRGWLDPQGRVRLENTEELLEMRSDPEASIHTIADYARNNLVFFGNNGIPIPPDDQGKARLAYLGHLLGPGDAIAYLSDTGISEERAMKLLSAQIGETAARQAIEKHGSAMQANAVWVETFVTSHIRTQKFQDLAVN